MKIIYDSIQFELTRRCNQECMHCCRGKSQNIDLTREVVDSFFEKNDIYEINHLMFSGGEPTLNGEMLEYIVDKIIEKNIIVYTFQLSINGLNYNESFVNGLVKLNNYCKRFFRKEYARCGILFISESQYHKPYDPKVVEKFEKYPFFVKPKGITKIDSKNLLPYGNAYKNNLTNNKADFENITDYNSTFKIKRYCDEDYLCINSQYISSNGNVHKDGCISYEMIDEYKIGNVIDSTIEKMYTRDIKKLSFKKNIYY